MSAAGAPPDILAAGLAAAGATRELAQGRQGADFVRDIGRQLARLHALPPPVPAGTATSPWRTAIGRLQAALDERALHRPALEWALRALAQVAVETSRVTRIHGAFDRHRIVADPEGRVAFTDWHLMATGDPLSDLGTFCAACHRGPRTDLEAGGLGPRDALYAGYASISGSPVDDRAVRLWEMLAHVRAAIAALDAARAGTLPGALRATRLAELELSLLRMTSPERVLP